MKPEYLKTLWMLRFQKLKKAEAGAAWGYQEILNNCLVKFGTENQVAKLLQRLITEERKHEILADELIEICQRNHPECGTL